MTTGRLPFEGDTPFAVGVKQKSELPKDPKELNTQIPDDLSNMILKCLEKDKEKRYQNASELASELLKIEEGIPTTEKVILQRKMKTEVISEFKWKKAATYGGIALLLVILIVGGIYLFTGRQEAIYSIAVLPLANLSGDPQQEYFADGMTEALITELSKISALQRVISRTSVMQYKGVRKSMQEISRELNVDAVVEGSVMFVGERVRITAQLIHAPKDKHIWADNYERDLSDILDLQREVAEAIVKEIKVKLTPQEEVQLRTTQKINSEAYQSYLKGLFYWNKRTGEDLKTAIKYFEMAIEKDPNYALAYAGLADCYNLLHLFADLHPSKTFPKAKTAAIKALEIDDNLAEAHNSLAYAKIRYDFDWEGAEREFRRAIELNPNYATGHFWYAELLVQSGRIDEGLSEIKRATELDPVSLVINSTLGIFYAVAGQNEQAIAQLGKTLEMDPDFAYAHRHLGMVYLIMNKFPEAIAELEKALELSDRSAFYLASLGGAYARAGQPDKARQILGELQSLSKELHIGPCYFAAIYAELGEEDKAFWWLEKAYEERYEDLVFLKINNHFDPIRSDPKFKVLLKKVGFE
jgi:TolB-like protein